MVNDPWEEQRGNDYSSRKEGTLGKELTWWGLWGALNLCHHPPSDPGFTYVHSCGERSSPPLGDNGGITHLHNLFHVTAQKEAY